MAITLPTAKINGKLAYGQAHMQPGINNWIGVCIISNRLLAKGPEKLKAFVIEYEGPFNCGEECINGKGKATVLHTTPTQEKDHTIITIEGIEEPQLEKGLKKELRFSYDENLPVYFKTRRKRSGH